MKADNPTVLTLIGAIIGILIFNIGNDAPWLCIFLALTLGLFSLTLRDEPNVPKTLAFALVTAGFLALCGFYGQVEHYYAPEYLAPRVSTGKSFYATFLLIIAMPFFMAYIDQGKPSTDYKLLHQYAWDRPFLHFGGVLFLLILWMILWIWMSLFKAIGIPVFHDVFTDKYFIAASIGGGYALGISILMRQEKIIAAMRHLAETLFSVLAPVLAILVVTFIAVLPITGLGAIWGLGQTAALIAAVIVLSITMINAVIRDGQSVPSRALVLSARVLAVPLPFLTLLALIALQMRIDQYGLTPRRIDALVLLTIAMLYSCTYAAAVVVRWKRDWDSRLRQINVINAVVVFAICAIMLLPFVRMEGISAWQQKRAFLSGKISLDDFDFAALKYKMGPAGVKALEEIRAAAPTYKQSAALLEQFKKVDASKNYYELSKNSRGASNGITPARVAEVIDVFPKGQTIPEALRVSLAGNEWNLNKCLENERVPEQRCLMVMADVMGDSQPEALLFVDKNRVPGVHTLNADGKWDNLSSANFKVTYKGSMPLAEIRRDVEAGKVKAMVPDFKMLKIGDRILQILPREAP